MDSPLTQQLLLILHHVPFAETFVAITIAVLSSWLFSKVSDPTSTLPFINNRKWYEFGYFQAKNRFLADGKNLIKSGFEKGDVFRMVMDNGVIMVLHPKYANEIRNIEGLSFSESLAEDFHAQVPGFDPFTSEKLILDVIRNKLTKKLEWYSIPLRTNILKLVARLTSKTLLGNEIGRNPDWQNIMVNYTVDAFIAAYILRLFPKFLRPLASRFIPHCRKLRKEISEARRIINPVLKDRQALEERAGAQNGAYEDGFDWLKQCAGERNYDPVIAQLSLTVVAIHTTSDMLTQVLFDIAQRPELIKHMRKEIIRVFYGDKAGLTRGNLQRLTLMDSVMKESQRMKPINIVSMRRRANYDIRLSDGTLIPKGTMLCVSDHWMWDRAIYRNPEEFDPYRFCKTDSFAYDFSSKFVSPSPEHLGFGLGRHACPGRFFAATEVKIILCHILLKFDIELPARVKPQVMKVGASLSADLDAKVMLKKRWEEIGLF
ncbi:cytochrome P450 [Aspergillus steynii IBT 23096]|uniref:Cytochrome P450 n=1 Tax=Aspergillus steynii IBT 23096 TaxID=1392250 RepID=A0A2I2G3V8_9EURO|nr:cytochrome P450 [Aspergillus steynii IBT 23096]PLB47565.1 cytochrome P450 [Aspergillus steynii IBT 23096]